MIGDVGWAAIPMYADLPPDQKQCERCREIFTRPDNYPDYRWNKRRFCSKACATKHVWETTGYSRPSQPVEDRFWAKVIKRNSGCWAWSGGTDGRGYGTLTVKKGASPVKAHRLSWAIHFGEIPAGMCVCHACDNPECTNPEHLLLGTQTANNVDAAAKGRMGKRKQELADDK